MQTPTISFIVPCYKLAHLLPACVNSILSQTYRDLEVLIMDDCSPDNTPEVARSFQDPRVKHIRNNPNLGHLRNYNKGLKIACGRYLWLISADDYLRQPYILEKYVRLMDQHPHIGYCFCPGVGVKNGQETQTLGYSAYGNHDCIIPGHTLLTKLLRTNTIVAASGLVRRECYEQLGYFPLDMPWAGDWYLWCLFALRFHVGFFSEPMVCYREHELSMTSKLWKEDVTACCEEDVAIPWRIKGKADEFGLQTVSRNCLQAVSGIYIKSIISKRYGMSVPSLNLEQFDNSLRKNTDNEQERDFVRAKVYAGIGNDYFWKGDQVQARLFYARALQKDAWMFKVHAKKFLLSLGKPGNVIWKSLKSRG